MFNRSHKHRRILELKFDEPQTIYNFLHRSSLSTFECYLPHFQSHGCVNWLEREPSRIELQGWLLVGLFERAASNSVLEMKLIIQPPSAGACWLGTNDHLHLGTDKIMTHSVIRLKFHATQHWTSGRKDQSNSTPPHSFWFLNL